jgi:hypothetical protein
MLTRNVDRSFIGVAASVTRLIGPKLDLVSGGRSFLLHAEADSLRSGSCARVKAPNLTHMQDTKMKSKQTTCDAISRKQSEHTTVPNRDNRKTTIPSHGGRLLRTGPDIQRSALGVVAPSLPCLDTRPALFHSPGPARQL